MKNNKKQNAAVKTSVVTNAIESNMQYRHYRSPKGGHGFAAEDANALSDKLLGRSVDKVGANNASNGADRITNGTAIQTKYCADARKTINAAFEDKVLGDGSRIKHGGEYRYGNQKIEVPKDQYDECVRLMEAKIRDGKVPGVTNPSEARNIIKRGSVTREQAGRITKAGNLDSLKFDVKNNVKGSVVAGGLSGAVTYYQCRKNGMSKKESAANAVKQGGKDSAKTMVIGVASQQILRTQAGRTIVAATENAVKPIVGRAVAAGVVKGSTANAVTRIAGSNAVVGAVAMTATMIPDIVKVANGKMSSRQFAENTATNASGIGGGWAGASIGTAICPGIGTVVGCIVGGIAASKLGNSLFKLCF